MKFGFIAKHRSVWPAAWLCEALGGSRSGFHAWRKRGPGGRSREGDAIMPAVKGELRGERPHLWRASGLARRAGSRLLVRLAQDRTPDARSGSAGAAAQAHPAERPRRTFGFGDRAECARSPVHGRPAQPQMDRRLQCAAASGVRDGDRSPAISLQERVANHRKRRWSKARVVSVTEKALQRRQVGDRKANTREPPYKCRKLSDDVETGE